jgi:oxygen-independent coproporphyrinogen-3 oxidase
MTRLRTAKGVSLLEVQERFGTTYTSYLLKHVQPYLEQHLLFKDEKCIYVTKKGKFLSDGIASDLFLVKLT